MKSVTSIKSTTVRRCSKKRLFADGSVSGQPLLEDHFQRLPEPISHAIFRSLPPVTVAGVCALVSKSWRDHSNDQVLWEMFCGEHGMSREDARECMGGWKGLYGKVFHTNFVASPCFEPLDRIKAARLKRENLGPWEVRHRIGVDRLRSDADEEASLFSHWSIEGGSVFRRGGGDGIIREFPAEGCCECPGAPNSPVLATSHEWGTVYQYIGFHNFSERLLDTSPPILMSAWYGGRGDRDSRFRMELSLRDVRKTPLLTWESPELVAPRGTWKCVRYLLVSYPAGLKSAIFKVGGVEVDGTSGFYGAKITQLHLGFVPRQMIANLGPNVIRIQPPQALTSASDDNSPGNSKHSL